MVGDSGQFWNDDRLKRVIFCLFVSLAIASFILCQNGASLRMLLEGDFPGFYSPGWTILHEDPERLYDFSLQQKIQNHFWPDRGAFYISVYPPYTALLLSPFALFDPLTAKILATCLGFAFLLSSLQVVGKTLPFPPVISFFFLLAFAPVFISIASAQNTTLSLLLYSLALRFYSRNSKSGDALAGIFLGLWLYKPQFAIPMIVFPLMAFRFWTLLGVIPVAILYAVSSTMLLGPSWLNQWYDAASAFGFINYEINSDQMISIIGFFDSIRRSLGSTEVTVFLRSGVVCSGLLLGFLVRQFFLARGTPQKFMKAYVDAAPALLLLSPQTLFYDLGIASIALLYSVRRKSDRSITVFFFILGIALLVEMMRLKTEHNLFFPFAVFLFLHVRRQAQFPSVEGTVAASPSPSPWP